MIEAEPKHKAPSRATAVHPDGSHAQVLLPQHREELEKSGLNASTIEANGVRSETRANVLAKILKWKSWRQGHAMIFPYFAYDARDDADHAPRFIRLKPTAPRRVADGETQKIIKYEQPKGVAVEPYFPAGTRREQRIESHDVIYITEGEKKAMLLDQLGLAVIGVAGVYNVHDPRIYRDQGVLRWHPEIARFSPILKGKMVVIAYDSDARTNPQVLTAARRLAGLIARDGAYPRMLDWGRMTQPNIKCGIDDYFVEAGEHAARAALAVDACVEVADPIDPDNVCEFIARGNRMEALQLPHELQVPHGYQVGLGGKIERIEGDRAIVVCLSPVVPIAIYEGDKGDEWVELAHLDKDRMRVTSLVPRKATRDARVAIASFPDTIAITSATAGGMTQWISECVVRNAHVMERGLVMVRSGWHKRVDEEYYFAIGKDAIGTKKPVRSDVDESLGKALVAHGDPAQERANIARAVGADPVAAVAVYAALAAPLVRVLGVQTFGLVLHGHTTRGKSTMSKVAASVYGDSRCARYWASANNTRNYVEHMAHAVCDLPLFLDEIGANRGHGDESLARVVYDLSQGSGRGRLGRDMRARPQTHYHGVMIATGEHPLIGPRDPAGLHARTLQVPVFGFGGLDGVAVGAMAMAAQEHYGHLGREWLAHVVALVRSPATLQAAREQHAAIRKELAAAFPHSPVQQRQCDAWAILELVSRLAPPLGLPRNGAVAAAMALCAEQTGDGDINPSERLWEALEASIATERHRWPAIRYEGPPQRQQATTGEHAMHGGIYGAVEPGRGEVWVLPAYLQGLAAANAVDLAAAVRDWAGLGRVWRDGTHMATKRALNGVRGRYYVLRGLAQATGGAGAAGWEPGPEEYAQ